MRRLQVLRLRTPVSTTRPTLLLAIPAAPPLRLSQWRVGSSCWPYGLPRFYFEAIWEHLLLQAYKETIEAVLQKHRSDLKGFARIRLSTVASFLAKASSSLCL